MPTNPMQHFAGHACAVGAVAVLAVSLDAADPNNAAGPMALPTVAAMIRWSGIENLHGKNAGLMSSIVLDTGLGLMAADIITFWT